MKSLVLVLDLIHFNIIMVFIFIILYYIEKSTYNDSLKVLSPNSINVNNFNNINKLTNNILSGETNNRSNDQNNLKIREQNKIYAKKVVKRSNGNMHS